MKGSLSSQVRLFKKMWLYALSIIFLLGVTISPLATNAETDEESNRIIGEMVMEMATLGAVLLNGELGDVHEEIVANGNREGDGYKKFQEVLKQIHEVTNATYVYTLVKVSDDMTHIIAESVDEDEADEYGTEYEMEPQFVTAFGGTPDHAVHTWEDEDYGVQKSAFAPIYNNAGDVVAILGIDYPIDDLLEADTNTLIGNKVKGMAAVGSLLLNGVLGDAHEKIVADGNRDGAEYGDFQDALKVIHDLTKATYIYTLIKIDDDMTHIIAESVDEDDADEYGTEYEMEPQFVTAFNGSPDYAIHTWDDEDYGTQKSAFAPVFNVAGEIVAILGVDYPAPELAEADEEEEEAVAEEEEAAEVDAEVEDEPTDTEQGSGIPGGAIVIIVILLVAGIVFLLVRKKK